LSDKPPIDEEFIMRKSVMMIVSFLVLAGAITSSHAKWAVTGYVNEVWTYADGSVMFRLINDAGQILNYDNTTTSGKLNYLFTTNSGTASAQTEFARATHATLLTALATGKKVTVETMDSSPVNWRWPVDFVYVVK
jgi:hypothetical protein